MKRHLIIGNPISHSMSPKLHNYWFKQNNIDAIYEKAQPKEEDIKKILQQVKSNNIWGMNVTVPFKKKDEIVLGADSVIDLEGKIISKPENREEALEILKKLNGKHHFLISSVCLSKNGKMIWHYSDKAKLTMKNFEILELKDYLAKLTDKALYAYNVYQIEGVGKDLFLKIEGNENTIMGLPIEKIKEYLKNL